MSGSFSVGKVAGIRVETHASWLIILGPLTAALATGYFPRTAPRFGPRGYWLASTGATLLLFVSILLHELGHALAARARGLRVIAITVFLLGGTTTLEQEPHSPGEETLVVGVGSLVSLVIGGILWLVARDARIRDPLIASALVYASTANLLLGAFTLLPALPLDGGRLLHALRWRVTRDFEQATHWASSVGQGIAGPLMLVGIWRLLSGALLSGLAIIITAWFLVQAAHAAKSSPCSDPASRGLTVGQLMAPTPPVVRPEMSLQELAGGYMLLQGLRMLLVVERERLARQVTLADLRMVPPDLWRSTRVHQVMRPAERLATVSLDEYLSDVCSRISVQPADQLPVLRHGRLVGVLRRDVLLLALAARSDRSQA
ncbi:MAG TPA: site-2 protease family protein [Ktedonobacterales bacterium]|nr:site-2 protease family protein [Ktedonobacterales bacterium]